MIISYEQDLRLIRTLLHAYGLSGSDAACVAEVVRHSDFTGVSLLFSAFCSRRGSYTPKRGGPLCKIDKSSRLNLVVLTN